MSLRMFSALVRNRAYLAPTYATDGLIPLAFMPISEMLCTGATGLQHNPSKESSMDTHTAQVAIECRAVGIKFA